MQREQTGDEMRQESLDDAMERFADALRSLIRLPSPHLVTVEVTWKDGFVYNLAFEDPEPVERDEPSTELREAMAKSILRNAMGPCTEGFYGTRAYELIAGKGRIYTCRKVSGRTTCKPDCDPRFAAVWG